MKKEEFCLYQEPVAGRRHDKRVFEKDLPLNYIPENVTLWGDTAFTGCTKIHPNSHIPKKGTRKHPLSPEQKSDNKVLSGIRIVAEHSICRY